MRPTTKRHILSICSLGIFCILAAGSMDDSSSRSKDATQPKASVYLEAGRNIVGPYRTFGNIRLNATAEDISCSPDDNLQCSGVTSAGAEWKADMYLDQARIYRVAGFNYEIEIPDTMSYSEIVHLWEEKLGPGTAGTRPGQDDDLLYFGNGDVGATASTTLYDGKVGVHVYSESAQNLYIQQSDQMQKQEEQNQNREAEQKYKPD